MCELFVFEHVVVLCEICRSKSGDQPLSRKASKATSTSNLPAAASTGTFEYKVFFFVLIPINIPSFLSQYITNIRLHSLAIRENIDPEESGSVADPNLAWVLINSVQQVPSPAFKF